MPYLHIDRPSGAKDVVAWAARAVAKGSNTQRIYWRNDPNARPGKPTTLGFTAEVRVGSTCRWAIGFSIAEAEHNALHGPLLWDRQRDAVGALYLGRLARLRPSQAPSVVAEGSGR